MTARRGATVDVAYFLGGAGLLASSLLHWVGRGAGSALRGHALVDAVIALGRDVPGLSAARLTVCWYAVPAIGAVSWIALGLTGARSTSSRIVAGVAVVIAVAVVAAFTAVVGLDDLAAGPWLALAGALVLAGAAFAPRRLVADRSQ